MDLEDPIACEPLRALALPLCDQGRPFFYVLIDATTNKREDNNSIKHAFAFENLNRWFAKLPTPTNPVNRQHIDKLEIRMMAKKNGGEMLDYYIGTSLFDTNDNEWIGNFASIVATAVGSPSNNNMALLYLVHLLQLGDAQQQQQQKQRAELTDDATAAADCIWAMLKQKWKENSPSTCQQDIASFVEHMIQLGDTQTFRAVHRDPKLCDRLGISSLVNTRLPSGHIPLTLAVDSGAATFVRLLLELEANPNNFYIDNSASSPYGIFITAGGGRHVSGSSPLSIALFKEAYPQRNEIIEALLTAGARIDTVNVNGVTPLFAFNYMQVKDENCNNETIVREIEERVRKLSSSFAAIN